MQLQSLLSLGITKYEVTNHLEALQADAFYLGSKTKCEQRNT